VGKEPLPICEKPEIVVTAASEMLLVSCEAIRLASSVMKILEFCNCSDGRGELLLCFR